jgi:16S rRNA (adenine1518-N6/adenine1519-N6)-dimethyltransferase
VLTKRLVGRAGHVTVVELDERLARALADDCGGAGLEVVHGDFMTYDLAPHRDLLVLGNLPYNLSSQMLFRLLDHPGAWCRAVLTTQREFAQRLLAEPGGKEYAALTVFFDRLTIRQRLFNIPASCFKPRPDVVSTAFRLERRLEPAYPIEDEMTFRRVVKCCFLQRRKTVANNLSSQLGLTRGRATELLVEANIDPGIRAEMLSGQAFARLADTVRRAGIAVGAR